MIIFTHLGNDSLLPATGKEVLAPASEETHFCDAHGTGVDCGDAHPVTSSLQVQRQTVSRLMIVLSFVNMVPRIFILLI